MAPGRPTPWERAIRPTGAHENWAAPHSSPPGSLRFPLPGVLPAENRPGAPFPVGLRRGGRRGAGPSPGASPLGPLAARGVARRRTQKTPSAPRGGMALGAGEFTLEGESLVRGGDQRLAFIFFFP
jgi:hypothetical protein